MTERAQARTSVFITYSRIDKALVDRIAEYLTSVDIDVWVDLQSIPPSSDWLDQIRHGIESKESYVFVISPDSVRSEVCCEIELRHALGANKRLIPVLARKTKHAEIPAAVSAKDWIDFSSEELYVQAFAELFWALTTDLEQVRKHTWLLGLARTWESRERDPSALLAGRILADAVDWLNESDPDTEPAPTTLHRDFITISRREEDLAGAVVKVAHGQALVRNHQPAPARTLLEQASAVYERHGRSPILANLGLWALGRACPRPHMWIPTGGLRLLSVGWAHDASTLFSVDTGAVVRLFDPHDGSLLSERTLATESPTVVALLPDENTLAVGAADGQVLLWDLEDGSLVREWRAHDGRITTLAVDVAGETLITGSFDCTAKAWTIASGSLVCELHGHTTPVTSAAISADGLRAVTGSLGMPVIPDSNAVNLAGRGNDQTLRCWSLPDGAQLPGFDVGDSHITRVVPVNGGEMFVAASVDYGGEPNGVQFWDGATGSLLGSVAHRAGTVFDFAATPSGDCLVLDTLQDRLFVWEPNVDGIVSVLEHRSGVSAIAVSTDASEVLAGTEEGEIIYWKVVEDRAVRTIETGARSVPAVALTSGADRMWTAAGIRTGDIGAIWYMNEVVRGTGAYPLAQWDVHTGLFLGTPGSTTSPMTAMTAARAADVAVAADLTKNVMHWSGTAARSLTFEAESEGPVTDLDITDDGAILLVVQGTSITVYDLVSHQVLHTLRGHQQMVRSASFIAARRAVVSVSDDGTLRLWSLATGENVLVLDHPNAGISQVAVSGDGRWLMAGTTDGARAWDLDSPMRPVQMFGHDGRVNAVCLSYDGTVSASGGDDGTIRIWHTPTGRELYALQEHTRAVTRLSFAADDQLMTCSRSDGTVTVFDFRFGAATARTEQAAHDAFINVLSGNEDLSSLVVLARWFGLRGDWSRAATFLYRTRHNDVGEMRGLDAARSYWASGNPLEAWDELDCVPASPEESILRQAISNAAVRELNERLEASDAGGAERMLDRRPELLSTVDTRNGDRTPLHIACAAGNEIVVRLLLERGADLNARTNDGWTPLHEAADGSAELLRALLARGADPNAASAAGYTPLHRAAFTSSVDAVEVLLNAGASVVAVDDGGLTALHFAADRGNTVIVRRLLEAGADLTTVDHGGLTPADFAKRRGWHATAAMLRLT
jgi:WD40 repeat protein